MRDDDGSSPRQIHEAFTRLMRWAQRGDVRRSLQAAAAETLSMNDITLLRAISSHGPLRASDLAAWQGVDKSTITPQVRRLEERGLVAREGDPGDRRAALLTVTAQGRRKLRVMNDSGTRLFERALDGWSADDRQTLATLMQRLAAGLAAVPKESTMPHRQRTLDV